MNASAQDKFIDLYHSGNIVVDEFEPVRPYANQMKTKIGQEFVAAYEDWVYGNRSKSDNIPDKTYALVTDIYNENYFRASYKDLLRHDKVCYKNAEIHPDYVLLAGYFQMGAGEVKNYFDIRHMNIAGINVANHVDHVIVDDADARWASGYSLWMNAPGEKVIDYTCIRGCSDAAFEKMIHDAHAIRAKGFIIDSVGQNLFYCRDKDIFTFIDIIPADKWFWGTFFDMVRNKVKFDPSVAFFHLNMAGCKNKSTAKTVRHMLRNRHNGDLPSFWRNRIRAAVKKLPEITRTEKEKVWAQMDWESANQNIILRENFIKMGLDPARIPEFGLDITAPMILADNKWIYEKYNKQR